MVYKEFKNMIKNPAYFVLIILPFALSFFMSEGTKGYVLEMTSGNEGITTIDNVTLYEGITLGAVEQFAVSELSFSLMMISVLIALNVFEERNLHTWDRIVNKKNFIAIKFILHYIFALYICIIYLHYIFALLIIFISTLLYKLIFNLSIPLQGIITFATIPFISLIFGILMGLILSTRAMVSNTTLLIIMFNGYIGGGLSLTSVLLNTGVMRFLMYLSPLTIANKIIFKTMLGILHYLNIIGWCAIIICTVCLCSFLINRRIKNGSVI